MNSNIIILKHVSFIVEGHSDTLNEEYSNLLIKSDKLAISILLPSAMDKRNSMSLALLTHTCNVVCLLVSQATVGKRILANR